jgi:hypothetical protein
LTVRKSSTRHKNLRPEEQTIFQRNRTNRNLDDDDDDDDGIGGNDEYDDNDMLTCGEAVTFHKR